MGPFPCCIPGLCMDELITMFITISGRWGGRRHHRCSGGLLPQRLSRRGRRGGGGCSRREPPPHATRGGRRGRYGRLDGRPTPTGTSRHGPGSTPPPHPQSPPTRPSPIPTSTVLPHATHKTTCTRPPGRPTVGRGTQLVQSAGRLRRGSAARRAGSAKRHGDAASLRVWAVHSVAAGGTRSSGVARRYGGDADHGCRVVAWTRPTGGSVRSSCPRWDARRSGRGHHTQPIHRHRQVALRSHTTRAHRGQPLPIHTGPRVATQADPAEACSPPPRVLPAPGNQGHP